MKKLFIVLAFLVIVPSTSAQVRGIVRLNEGSAAAGGQASGFCLGEKNGETYIVTAAHCVRLGNVTVELFPGTHPAKVLATRPVPDDVALIKIRAPALHLYKLADKFVGYGWLKGCPMGIDPVSWSCRMNPKGDLDIKVIAGGCGGPFVIGGKVGGILTRYHGCTTADKIKAFLKAEGYGWLCEETEIAHELNRMEKLLQEARGVK